MAHTEIDLSAESGRLSRGTQTSVAPESVVAFEFEGRTVTAREGDSIASALYASGIRTFSRSFKYHRPRGLMCVRGHCPNCLVQVDETPNMRACMTPVTDGMKISRQNAWPSADRDLLQSIERFSSFLPVGFYYKTFVRPRFLWPYAERVIRKVAGLGKVDLSQPSTRSYDRRYLHADVAVVGGGLSGMAAAVAAACADVDVVLVDDQQELGGSCFYRLTEAPGPDGELLPAPDAAKRWSETIQQDERIRTLQGATAFGLFEDNRLAIIQDDVVVEVFADQIVIASGTFEQPMLFENNDLPGVFMADGALRLVELHDIKIGEQIAVAGNGGRVADVALRLLERGCNVIAVATEDPSMQGDGWETLQAKGVTRYTGHGILAAAGNRSVRGVSLVPLRPDGEPDRKARVLISCDTIVTVGHQIANDYLVGQAGPRLQGVEPDLALLASLDDNIQIAGSIAGYRDPGEILESGRAAGMRAASSPDEMPGSASNGSLAPMEMLNRLAEEDLHPGGVGGEKSYVCLCGDVTSEDIHRSIAEGFDDIETLKRYSTVTMGPCQGRMCSCASRALLAQDTGVKLSQIPVTTSRPPAVPVTLGALAGPKFMVEARSPLFDIHSELKAAPIETGHWIRADHYGDPNEEVRAVRDRVGLIDVSTLGRIEIRGDQAGAFIDRIYTGKFSNLKVGRLRYGIICNESGAIMDEGVVCRFAKDRYFVTTSTSGHSSTLQWFNWWKEIWDTDIQILDVTAVYGAMNLAGPLSREVLQPFVDVDISQSAFPMLRVAEATVAGVPCLLMRVGFVGELGYEIHFPSDYGDYLWNLLMEAGQPHGIRPFGVEAQKILRLEKGHLIAGQDTDGLVDPFSANLGWTVKLEKPDFIGKQSLTIISEQGLSQKLVPFIVGEDGIVPPEGTQVVQADRSVGRVTSCRYSPALGKVIGLGWVPEYLSRPGSRVPLDVNGDMTTVLVVDGLYDPAGDRQKL